MYVYFDRSGILASPATFYAMDTFYGRFFRYGELDLSAFTQLLLLNKNHMQYLPATPVWLNDEAMLSGTHEMVMYLYHLTSQRSGEPTPGVIIFLIDTGEIRKKLDSLEIGPGGLAAVLDDKKRIIALRDNGSGYSPEQILQIAGEQGGSSGGRLLVSSVSDHNGWTYLALGNRSVVMKPVVALSRIFIVLFVVSLAGGLAMALSMARKRSLPL